MLISWWDEDFIRKFLSQWGVVIVTLEPFKEDPSTFWDIMMSLMYNQTEIQLLMPWEDLEERILFVSFLWLAPQVANFVSKPIPELQMQELIKKVFTDIKEAREKEKEKEEQAEAAEVKKYQERWIEEWLAVLNDMIDRIEQIKKVWTGILLWQDLKKLEDLENEIKKIRLWTNFNKMAELVFETQTLIWKLQTTLFAALWNDKFMIDRNSHITNIDVISECFELSKAHNKFIFQPKAMTTTETMYQALWSGMIFTDFIIQDIKDSLQETEWKDIFDVVMNLVEYGVLTATIVLCLIRLIAPIFWSDKVSLYFLPAFGWLWLLLYLFNNLKMKKVWAKIVILIIMLWLYWYGLILLKNTFSLCSLLELFNLYFFISVLITCFLSVSFKSSRLLLFKYE